MESKRENSIQLSSLEINLITVFTTLTWEIVLVCVVLRLVSTHHSLVLPSLVLATLLCSIEGNYMYHLLNTIRNILFAIIMNLYPCISFFCITTLYLILE